MDPVPVANFLGFQQVMGWKNCLPKRLHMTTSSLVISRNVDGTYMVTIEGYEKHAVCLQSPEVVWTTMRNLCRLGQPNFTQENQKAVHKMCLDLLDIEDSDAIKQVFGERMVTAVLEALSYDAGAVFGSVNSYSDGITQLSISGLSLRRVLKDGQWQSGPVLFRSVNEQFQFDHNDDLILTQDESEYMLAQANNASAV